MRFGFEVHPAPPLKLTMDPEPEPQMSLFDTGKPVSAVKKIKPLGI
jgi:hypothetical protein